MNSKDIENCREIRRQIFITAKRGGTAHLASAYSCVEILYTLFEKGILNLTPENIRDNSRDRFVLSKGHAGLALYSVMSRVGLLSAHIMEDYLKPEMGIGGEPCMRDLPGIEASTGSLGHGLSMASGMAMAQKLDQIIAKTYVLLGDGECEEGVIWEAAMSSAALHLNNLYAILDCNGIQKMCSVQDTIGFVQWKQKWESFGWIVREVNGHDTEELFRCFQEENTTNQPVLIIANTIKGKGVSIMENNPIWHFKMPNKKETKFFLEELGLTQEQLG